MSADPVLVALPGTMCTPAVFGPLARALASQRDLDLTGELGTITQPSVVVHGRYDRARPPGQGRELAASRPDAEFRLVEEAGHTPVYETPDAVAAAVRDVLERVRRRAC